MVPSCIFMKHLFLHSVFSINASVTSSTEVIKSKTVNSNGEREDIFMSQSICEKGCFLAPYVFSLFSFSCIFFFLFYDLLAGIYFCFLQVPIMVVMKAMGLESDQEVVRMVGRDPRLSAMLLPSIEVIYVVKDSKSIIIFVLKERM